MKDMSKYNITCFNSFSFKENETLDTFIMPDHKGWGLKLVRHNLHELKPEEDNMEYQTKWIEAKARQFFGDDFIKINKIENCYYTITPTHDFILDYLDGEKRNMFIVSCCSGHGFKFSPIIGDIVAQVVSSEKEGETTNQAYNNWKHLFKFSYHKEKGLY
jgi:glycine/D-amino acid oxidase-like deaminating enzyme